MTGVLGERTHHPIQPMKKLRFPFTALIITGLLCGSAVAADRENAAPDKPKKSAFRTTGAPVETWHFEDIDFDEMPMRDVVEYLRTTMEKTDVNFILSRDIADVSISLKLRNVPFDQLTVALEIASEGQVRIESVDGRLYHVRPGEVRAPRLEPVMRVFNLSKYLEGKEGKDETGALENLQQTVDMAFELLSKAQSAAGGGSRALDAGKTINSKYHPGTKLMIVIGSPDYVQVFEDVTSQLLGEPRRGIRVGGNPYGAMGMGGLGDMEQAGMFGGTIRGGGDEFGLDAGSGGYSSGAGAGAGISYGYGGGSGGSGGQQRVRTTGTAGGGGVPPQAQDPFAGPKKGR